MYKPYCVESGSDISQKSGCHFGYWSTANLNPVHYMTRKKLLLTLLCGSDWRARPRGPATTTASNHSIFGDTSSTDCLWIDAEYVRLRVTENFLVCSSVIRGSGGGGSLKASLRQTGKRREQHQRQKEHPKPRFSCLCYFKFRSTLISSVPAAPWFGAQSFQFQKGATARQAHGRLEDADGQWWTQHL